MSAAMFWEFPKQVKTRFNLTIFLIIFQISMNAFLVVFLININILLITVTTTPTAPIPKVPFIARVIRDTREMGSRVKVT